MRNTQHPQRFATLRKRAQFVRLELEIRCSIRLSYGRICWVDQCKKVGEMNRLSIRCCSKQAENCCLVASQILIFGTVNRAWIVLNAAASAASNGSQTVGRIGNFSGRGRALPSNKESISRKSFSVDGLPGPLHHSANGSSNRNRQVVQQRLLSLIFFWPFFIASWNLLEERRRRRIHSLTILHG